MEDESSIGSSTLSGVELFPLGKGFGFLLYDGTFVEPDKKWMSVNCKVCTKVANCDSIIYHE